MAKMTTEELLGGGDVGDDDVGHGCRGERIIGGEQRHQRKHALAAVDGNEKLFARDDPEARRGVGG